MIVDLERGSEAVKKKFLGVLAYFGEDAGMSSTEFFTTLHKFVLVSFQIILSASESHSATYVYVQHNLIVVMLLV